MKGRIFTIFVIISLLLGSSLALNGALAIESQPEKDSHQDEINGPGGLMSLQGPPIQATNPSNPLQIKEHHPAHIKKFIGPSVSSSAVYAPVTILSAYNFNKLGCAHTTTKDWTDPSLCGHGQTIAIVDAFDDPNIASDLQTFDSQWGLPACTVANGCFTKAIPQGTPSTDSGWALEISLDVEWAHSVAPGAKIVLVESSDNTLGNLLSAVDTAVGTGAQQVSNSWGGSEFPTESSYDYHYSSATASFFVSSGDGGHGVEYPAASPYVISVGGTTLNVDSSGNYVSETAWSGSGGGLSTYEQKPSYQNNFNPNSNRAVPDVAYNADPNTGVYVYDSVPIGRNAGWWQVGGTSAGAPQWAGISAIINSQNAKLASASFGTSSALYGAATGSAYLTNYHDITSGSNGNCGSLCNAGPGYDEVTGLGSPQVNNLISYFSLPSTDFSISSSPSSVTVQQGGIGSSTITVTSLNGFNSAVTLTVTAPSGISASVLPTPVTPASGGSATSTLSITVPSTTATGSYTITVTGTSSSLSHTTTVALTVSSLPPPPPPPDFSLSASPTSLTIQQGHFDSSTVTVTPSNGFAGAVTLSLSGNPSGVTATFAPNPTSTTSTLTITVGSSVPAGSYSLTVTGTSGSLTHSTSVTVNVQTVPSLPQNLQATAGNTQVKLSWQAPSSNGGSAITSYKIYRSTSSGSETLLASTGNVLSYTDTEVTNGLTYYYKVSAVNSVGESALSNEASATPQQTPTLTVSVTTDQSTYHHSSTAHITVKVTSGSTSVSGASVTLTVKNPNGSTSHSTGTTNSNGQVTFSYYISRHATTGTYTASATATKSGYISGSGSTTFIVNSVSAHDE